MVQLGGFAFIGEGIPIGLGAAFQIKYRRVSFYLPLAEDTSLCNYIAHGYRSWALEDLSEQRI